MTTTQREQIEMNQQALHRDLHLIIVAVTFGMVYMTVYNGPSLNAFIRSLGAGDFVFAVIMAMPVFTGLLQLLASIVLQKVGKRKSLFIFFGFVQRLILIPTALVPVFLPEKFQGMRILLVLLLIAVNSGAQAFMSIIYSSWMGALVPTEIRGRYFSRRSLISTIASLIVAPLSGLFLDVVKGPMGYAILFSIVAIIGSIDIVFFFWIRDPVMVAPKQHKSIYMILLSPLKDANYRRFIIFTTAFSFSLNLSGSFFTPYMLEHLHMTMLAITILTQMTMSLFTILFIGKMGRLIDRFGTKNTMKVALSVIVSMPLFWIFTTPNNYIPLILIVQLIAGMFWPAYDLGNMNLSIWLAPEDERPSYLASYAFVIALFGILPGQLFGGAIMEGFGLYLEKHPTPWLFGRNMIPFDLLLVLTFVCRTMSFVFLFPRFHDNETKGTSQDVIKALFQKPSVWLRRKDEGTRLSK